MNENEIRLEVQKLLGFIYFESKVEITEDEISYWRENLRGVNTRLAWKAAKELCKRKTYGPPQFRDFWAVLLEVAPRTRFYDGRVSRETIIGIDQRPVKQMRGIVDSLVKKIGLDA